MSRFKEGFMLSAAPTCDGESLRYVNADMGEGKPIETVAKVLHLEHATLEENLEIASVLAAAPRLQSALRECMGFVEAWMFHLQDTGHLRAAKTVGNTLDQARKAYEQSCRYRASQVPETKA